MIQLDLSLAPLAVPAVALRQKLIAPVLAHLRQSSLFHDYRRAFEGLTGLPLVLRAAGSFRMPLEGSSRINPFCALMTRANQTCAACLQSQQRLEEAAALGPKTVRCHAGLSETAVPLRIGQTVFGYLQTGQVFLRAPSKRHLRAVDDLVRNAGLGVELAAWRTAYFKTRTIAPKQYGSIVRLLAIFAEHLATVSNQLILASAEVEPLAVTRVRTYIVAHHGEVMNLHDAARAANMNACHFCRVFKKSTGLTFTAFLGRTRVESVKRQLLNVHLRISEAAYAAGFQSLSQFNRTFRAITGETPGRYREQLHGLAPAVVRQPRLARAG